MRLFMCNYLFWFGFDSRFCIGEAKPLNFVLLSNCSFLYFVFICIYLQLNILLDSDLLFYWFLCTEYLLRLQNHSKMHDSDEEYLFLFLLIILCQFNSNWSRRKCESRTKILFWETVTSVLSFHFNKNGVQGFFLFSFFFGCAEINFCSAHRHDFNVDVQFGFEIYMFDWIIVCSLDTFCFHLLYTWNIVCFFFWYFIIYMKRIVILINRTISYYICIVIVFIHQCMSRFKSDRLASFIHSFDLFIYLKIKIDETKINSLKRNVLYRGKSMVIILIDV